MKILYILDVPIPANGCWYYRNQLPKKYLKAKGHFVKAIALGSEIQEEIMEWPDTVVFSRTYPRDPLPFVRAFQALGKRVIYEVDDILWKVNRDNPSAAVATEWVYQYKTMMEEVDAITTTTPKLAKELKKYSGNKNVFVCPNVPDPEVFADRPHENKRLIIGYSGAASHWKDLSMVTEAIKNLQKKHDFLFILQGMCGCPLEAEIFGYQKYLAHRLMPERTAYFKQAVDWYKGFKGVDFIHVPFYPPELFGGVLRGLDMDIGIAPLEDNSFNHNKSCVKFYEYARVGTVTLASDVLPYKKEVNYRAKNTVKDWEKKLEKLIVDKKFRLKTLKQQQEWVFKNRNPKIIVQEWEKAFDPK